MYVKLLNVLKKYLKGGKNLLFVNGGGVRSRAKYLDFAIIKIKENIKFSQKY